MCKPGGQGKNLNWKHIFGSLMVGIFIPPPLFFTTLLSSFSFLFHELFLMYLYSSLEVTLNPFLDIGVYKYQ